MGQGLAAKCEKRCNCVHEWLHDHDPITSQKAPARFSSMQPKSRKSIVAIAGCKTGGMHEACNSIASRLGICSIPSVRSDCSDCSADDNRHDHKPDNRPDHKPDDDGPEELNNDKSPRP